MLSLSWQGHQASVRFAAWAPFSHLGDSSQQTVTDHYRKPAVRIIYGRVVLGKLWV